MKIPSFYLGQPANSCTGCFGAGAVHGHHVFTENAVHLLIRLKERGRKVIITCASQTSAQSHLVKKNEDEVKSREKRRAHLKIFRHRSPFVIVAANRIGCHANSMTTSQARINSGLDLQPEWRSESADCTRCPPWRG